MNEQLNKDAVRAFFASIDRDQNMSAVDEVTATSYVANFPGAPPLDREGMKMYGNGFFAACPGLRHEVNDVISEGNLVAARLTITGTHTQPFQMPGGSIPASGRSFVLPVLNLYRFENGKIVEHTSAFDMMGFMQQIGAMP